MAKVATDGELCPSYRKETNDDRSTRKVDEGRTDGGPGVDERDPHFSPSGQQIAFTSFGRQPSNPEGDFEVYLMNNDGSEGQNLSNNADLSEFVFDHGELFAVLLREDAVEEGGFTGAEESGKDSDRDG